ncbi:hypothetical protein [Undibacterium oligocarboniphilum]|uniref:Uncharacterized protein n=1 Tax=Undibacterium oligocarboniphilum TaxID=666702 RepID=A0A850Q8X6_9BURK|nr:hypothetical protein [Undibacterium oligocarboniphilum]MBC3868751.1 hypothetical protein [Undibacterium oligocarboniphilum]NVO76732.1 hypothetical protein [Undibacterium oligocarboniphilum]
MHSHKDHGMVSGVAHDIETDSVTRHTVRKAYLPVLEDASQCQTKKQKSPQ